MLRSFASALLLACAACTAPMLFLPAVAALPPTTDHPSGAVVREHTLDLSYSVKLQAGTPVLSAEGVERVKVQVFDPNVARDFGRWLTQGVPNTTVVDAGLRVSQGDAQPLVVHPAPGTILEVPRTLQANDVIDVYVHRTYQLPQAMPPWVMTLAAPTDQVRVRIGAPPGLKLRVVQGRGTGKYDDITPEDTTWSLDVSNLPAVASGANAPPARHDGPWLVVVPVSYETAGVSAHWADSWDAVSAYVQHLLQPTMAVDADAARVLRDAPHSLFARLQPQDADLLPGAPRPFAQLQGATPLETAAVAVASVPGAQRAVALITRPQGAVLLPEVPGLYPFETALWAEPRDPGWSFADPLCATCETGQVGFDQAGGTALVLAAGKAALVPVPEAAPTSNVRRYQFDWNLSVEGQLQGTLLAEFQGPSARKVRGALLAPNDAAGRREATRQMLFESAGAAPEVQPLDEEEATPTGDDGHYAVQVSLRAHATAKPNAYELTPAVVAGDGFPWEVPADGTGDVSLPGPLVLEVTCTLQTPGGMVGRKPPKPVVVDSTFGKYEARFVQKQAMVVYTRRLNLNTRLVPHALRPALAAFAAQIRAAESTPLLLRAEE